MAVIKVTPEIMAQALAETDWAKVDATTDADIDRQIAEDADTAPVLSDADMVAVMARSVRARLGVSQRVFANRFGIPVGTLRDWEQGRKRPDATALSYLRVIARAPDIVEQALHPELA